MTSTVYEDLVGPPINAAWLNAVNNATYEALGSGGVAPTTPSEVISNLGLSTLYLAINGNAVTATTATNVNGGTVNATTGVFSDQVTVPAATASTSAVNLGQAETLSTTGNAATATTATNVSGGTVNATTGVFSSTLQVQTPTTAGEAVSLAISFGGLARYNNMTASRAYNTTYTNTSGIAMIVVFLGQVSVAASNSEVTGYVNGYTVTSETRYSGYMTLILFVFPGSTYEFINSVSGVNIVTWTEIY